MPNAIPNRAIVLFGATGFTGRLVLAEARRRGLSPVLAGRNEAALKELAESAGGAEIRVGDPERAASLEGIFEGAGVVINCAGPFLRLGEPVLAAAIAQGAHYLDTTGEQEWIRRAVERHSAEAERRGLTAVPAHAFEYAPGDCAARIAIESTPGAVSLEVFNRAEGFGTSRGTKKSALEAMRLPTLSLVAGELVAERTAAHRATVRFPDDERHRVGISFGGGEVLSARRHGAMIREARTYLVVPEAAAFVLPALTRIAIPLLDTPVGAWLERRIDAGSFGPGPERERQPWWIQARVRTSSGAGRRVSVSGRDIYGVTAVIAVSGACALLEGRALRAGVVSSAQAFDPRSVLAELEPHGATWREDPL
jgi:short subunit dehydrogenase-like uncharacterized protein